MGKEIGKFEQSVPLNVLSKYSLLDGQLATSSPEALFKRARDLGYPALAVSDTNWFSAAENFKASEDAEVKNIIGVTLPYTVGTGRHQLPITLLPRSTKAVSTVFGLYSEVKGEGKLLTPNKVRNLLSSDNTILLFEGNPFEPAIRDFLPHPNAYWAISNPNFQTRNQARDLLLDPQTAEKFVVAHDFRMTKTSDIPIMRFLMEAYPQSSLELPASQLQNHILQPSLSVASLYGTFPQGSLARSLEIAQMCNAEYPKPSDVRANSVPADWSGTSFEYLQSIINNLAEELNLKPELRNRVVKELELIDRFNFADYLFISREIIDYCQQEVIEHTVTGSANHSLVAYLMGITKVNPINLNYRVFLKEEREKDLPDIDIKVDARFLDLVKDFLIRSYPEYAVHMSQVQVMREKSIQNLIDEFKMKLTQQQKEQVLEAELPFRISKHITGILMAREVSPIQKIADNFLSPWTSKAVEILEFPNKFDILSSIGHERIGRTKELLEKQGVKIEIPYDDPETLTFLFSHLPKIGIAEGESPHAESWFWKIGQVVKNPNLYHIAMVMAIMRPATKEQRQALLEYFETEESELEGYEDIDAVLARTGYVPLYKEQEDELAQLIEAHANDYPEEVLQELQKRVETFTGYSFKEGHALAYAQMIYEQAYLRVHYPREFWTAVLQSIAFHGGTGNYPTQAYLNEALRQGIQLLLPDPNNIPQMPELIDEGIIIGSDLMAKTKDVYKRYRNMLGKYLKASTLQEQIDVQLETFGVCFTTNPTEGYNSKYHFNPQLERQKIIGTLLNQRTVKDYQGNEVVLITLDSGHIVHASVPKDKEKERIRKVAKKGKTIKSGTDKPIPLPEIFISIEYNPYAQRWEII